MAVREYKRIAPEFRPFKERFIRSCQNCGEWFVTHWPHRRNCSERCRVIYAGIQAERRGYQPPKYKPLKFCSVSFQRCGVCSRQFSSRVKTSFCSDNCRRENSRRYTRDRDEADHKAEPKRHLKTCRCGAVFCSIYGTGFRICSACTDENNRKHKRSAKSARRARIRSSKVESFDPFDVFDRDKWRCKLCGVATPKRLRGTLQDRAPELDHIVPLASGGEHSMRNTQCACRRCNNAKGSTALGQLSLF